MSYLKFTGKYRDLIPLGFRFQKLFGGNHRCYHTIDLKEENTLWVWQKGQEVEIDDWHQFTAPILQYIEGKECATRKVKLGNGQNFTTDSISFKCNMETGHIELRTPENSEARFGYQEMAGEITEKKHLDLYAAYFKKYRNITVSPSKLRETLKRIEGMYEIAEDDDG